MHTKGIFILTLLLIPSFLLAQQPSLKWGKISKLEWDMEACPFDSSASAIILMENEVILFSDGRAYLQVHRRIKILDEKGFDFANLEVPYYHYNNFEWVTKFKGVTFNKNEKGKVEKTTVKKTFKEKSNEYWSNFKVAFPAIKKGAIIEYKYQYATKDLMNLEPWEFQHEIPVLYSRVSVEQPDWLNYSILSFGSELRKKYDESPRNEWILENIPGYEDEDYVYNPKDYINKIRFQITQYKGRNGWESVIKNWNELGKEKKQDYKKVFRKAKKNKSLLNDLITEKDTDREKVEKIFNFVRNTYQWNGYYSTYPGKSFDKLLTTKKGNLADLNLWMTALMRTAGLEAYPVLISTKSHGKPISFFPLIKQFNTVICSVEIDGKPLLIDVVERGGKLPYDLLPKENLNYIGLKLGKDSTEWVNIPFDKKSRTQMLVDLDFNKREGSINARFNGYPASEKRLMVGEGRQLFIQGKLQGFAGQEIEFGQVEIKNEADSKLPLLFNYDLKLGEMPEDDFLYFSPARWTDFEESPFKKEKRTLPVELPYLYSNQLVIKLNYPTAYQLEEVPTDLVLNLPSDIGSFSFLVERKPTFCMLRIRFQMKEVYLSPVTYFYLKEFHDRISEKVNEALVFKRK